MLEVGSSDYRSEDPKSGKAPPQTVLARTASVLARTARTQGLVGMLALLIISFSLTSPYFLTFSNAFIIGGNMAALGIMALAQTFLIVAGGVDLSLGSVVALTTVIIGVLVNAGVNVWVAALIGFLCGPVIGGVNAVFIVVLGINPLITTLGTLSIVTGVSYVLTQAQSFLVTSPSFAAIGGYAGPIPVPLLGFLVLFLIALLVERFTITGRRIYAIGGNYEASRLAGIRASRVRFMLYVVSGASASLAGLVVTSQLGSASADVGSTYLLAVVTAVILGGTSLEGGRGTVVGTLVAAVVLGVLQNGFAQLQLSSYLTNVALGVALLIAVMSDRFTARQPRRALIR
jgi:ribose transport system permease protein